MDKTVKINAYSNDAKSNVSQGNLTEDQNKTLELAKKGSQLEEEKRRSLEHLLTIERLSSSLRQEQAKSVEMTKKTADLEAKVKEFALSGASELVKKNAQLEEEKKTSLEQLKMIEQLRESIKQEQLRSAGMVMKTAELESKIKELSVLETRVKEIPALEAKVKELAVWEAKVKELNDALGKISTIAAAGKVA